MILWDISYNILFVQYCGIKSGRLLQTTMLLSRRGVAVINSNGNSELARIYLRPAWRNSSRSKYDRPASILIRSGGLRASEKFPRKDRAWVAASEANRCEPSPAIYSHILVSFVNFFYRRNTLMDNIDVRPSLGYRVDIALSATRDPQGRFIRKRLRDSACANAS